MHINRRKLLTPPFNLAMAMALCGATVAGPALADTLVASYEPAESALAVTPNPSDTGLTCSMVMAASEGIEATEGDYVLKLAITGEDGKVELSHQWTGFTYNLTGNRELLFDIYIADSAVAPNLIGIWSSNWSPPDAWQQAGNIAPVEIWATISVDVSARNQTNLDNIWALVLEGMPGATGTIYIDNMRLSNGIPENVIATGHDKRIDIAWDSAGSSAQGYNIYRSGSAAGPFYRLNSATHTVTAYSDVLSSNDLTYYYQIKTVYAGGQTPASAVVSATSQAMTDDELMTSVQQAVFRYFWNFGHPISGMAREGLWHDRNTVTTGGTGMGLITLIVGAERGFISRQQAAERIVKILRFLDKSTTRYHGAWSHHINGMTGETIPFGTEDNGADLVETAFLVQGMLTVREYFDQEDNPIELEIRQRATKMWEEVQWSWFLPYYPGSQLLQWHWSPDYGFEVEGTRPVIGYDETMITYLLAIASPSFGIPTSCYYNGWCTGDSYINGDYYYGYKQWVGWAYGGPLFWTHYSFLGFDPRNKSDNYCNYYENCQNISRINRAYCADNPEGHDDYSELVWGLTTCYGPYGYLGYEPLPYRDDGTIAPTAALSAMPYTPTESLATLRHFYETYRSRLWGEFGFRDGFNPSLDYYSNTYIAIDQGPITPMIENARTGLCWNTFMGNPEIEPMLKNIGWNMPHTPRTPDNPGNTAAGLNYEYYEAAGLFEYLPYFPALESQEQGVVSNFDLSPRNRDDNFAFRFTGFIDIPASGIYQFYTDSDDGSRLYIGDRLVVDNDGLHGMDGDVSGSITLVAGQHEITVLFFDQYLDQGLNVSYQGPGIAKQAIPDHVLHRSAETGLPQLPDFASCLYGPQNAAPTGCAAFDMDGDTDVDLADFMIFQTNLITE